MNRGDKLALLRTLQIPACSAAEKYPAKHLIKHVLRAIDDHGEECYCTVETLALEINSSVRSVQRCIRALIAFGMVVDITADRKSRRSNTLVIDWVSIKRMVEGVTESPRLEKDAAANSRCSGDSRSLTVTQSHCNGDPQSIKGRLGDTQSASNPEVESQTKRSGSSDQMFSNEKTSCQSIQIEASAIAAQVRIIYDRLGYIGNDGWVFWNAMAGVHAGILASGDVGRTIEACKATPGRKGPGYFRRVLAEKAGMTGPKLTSKLKTVGIAWGEFQPGQRPEIKPVAAVPPRRPPARVSFGEQQHRQGEILNQLANVQRASQSNRMGERVMQPTSEPCSRRDGLQQSSA